MTTAAAKVEIPLVWGIPARYSLANSHCAICSLLARGSAPNLILGVEPGSFASGPHMYLKHPCPRAPARPPVSKTLSTLISLCPQWHLFSCSSNVPYSPPVIMSSTTTMTEESGKRKAGGALAAQNRPVKRRASKACCCCRARKVRCDVVENGSPCTNCRLDQVECVVTESKRRKFVLNSLPRKPKPFELM